MSANHIIVPMTVEQAEALRGAAHLRLHAEHVADPEAGHLEAAILALEAGLAIGKMPLVGWEVWCGDCAHPINSSCDDRDHDCDACHEVRALLGHGRPAAGRKP